MTEMKAEKKVDEKVDFRGPEDPKKPKASIKTKCIIGAVVFGILLASAAISLAVFFLTKPEPSKRLVDVNLEEGDTLTYRVEQRFEVTEQKLKKETITSIVGIQVVNKTTDAYWFLLKINTTFKDSNEKVEANVSGYFRVRLDHENNPPRAKTDKYKDTRNETIEAFELYGRLQTDDEFVRYLHGILYQLLPTVRRDLYEDVDGQTDDKLKPEDSPLLPGPVKMHRQADTKQSDNVLIKNHFNRSDLVNSSSRDMDVDVKYTDSAAINKSNGMVSESTVYLSEQLDFGEPIKTKDGHVIAMMNATLYSHVTRIETDSSFFVEEEIKALKIHLFVRLVVPTTENIDMKKYPAGKTMPRSSNSSSLNEPNDGQRLSTQTPTTTIIRNRRAVGPDFTSAGGGGGGNSTVAVPSSDGGGNSTVAVPTSDGGGNSTVVVPTQVTNSSSSNPKLILRKLLNSSVSIEKTFTLFDKKVIGIRTKGEGKVWLKTVDGVGDVNKIWEVGSDLYVVLASNKISLHETKYSNEEIELGFIKEKSFFWRKGIPFCFKVLFLRLCVEFSLRIQVNVKPPKLVLEETSLSPPKIALAVESFGEVVASIEAYVSVWVLRGGIFVDGTIVRATVPVKVSYDSLKPVNQWCLAANARLTALELHAGLFYQWKKCRISWWSFRCWWGDRNTLLSFGRLAAIQKNCQIFEHCFL